MTYPRLEGLVAAAFTPMYEDGTVNLETIPRYVQHLLDTGVRGVYVCGSTGEGPSLTSQERAAAAEAFVTASSGRMPVIVQVGHNSLPEARALAEHAASVKADAISAVPPSYFKPSGMHVLVRCCAEVASVAPALPFYYYHIPPMSGVEVNVPRFLEAAAPEIPNLAGVKFSDHRFDQMQACLELDERRFDVLSGVDQMLLSALSVGVRGAVGSMYNFAARLFNEIIVAFHAGNREKARHDQQKAVELVHLLVEAGGLSAFKYTMSLAGVDCGPIRLPASPLDDEVRDSLQGRLAARRLLEWIEPSSSRDRA